MSTVLRLVLRLLVAYGLAVAAAGGSAVALAAEPQVLRVAVIARTQGDTLLFNGVPQRVAQDPVLARELKARGATLEWVPITTASVATLVNEAFATHKIDFAYYGDLPSVILNAAGVPTRLVVPGGLGNNTYVVVPPGSTAKSLRDLKGKRVALHRGRPWEVSFARALAAEGLSLRDVRLVNLNPQAGAAALAAGSVDAFVTLNDAWQLVDRKLARVLWSTQQAPTDWKMRAELWGDAGYITRHPDLTQLLATSTVRAQHWVAQEQNRDTWLRDQARYGTPEAVLRRDSDGNRVSWKDSWSPAFDEALRQHYQSVATHAEQSGLVRKAPPVDSLLAPQFVAAALRELGLAGYWATR